ncbi:hypothetical protein ACSX1A_12970 [Pontibacter sp. MBLB2868]|uniref:hypothetical protein n=1 Tax=Pontibacter sp. MBLB2868 TaxID=3451555 RepID=UPI003F74D2EE
MPHHIMHDPLGLIISNKTMNVKSENLVRLKAYGGAMCMFIALIIQVIWINAFNAGGTHEERLAIFNNFFPKFLHGGYTLTFVSIGLCIVAVVLSNIAIKLPTVWKIISLITLIISVFLLLLNLYQLL